MFWLGSLGSIPPGFGQRTVEATKPLKTARMKSSEWAADFCRCRKHSKRVRASRPTPTLTYAWQALGTFLYQSSLSSIFFSYIFFFSVKDVSQGLMLVQGATNWWICSKSWRILGVPKKLPQKQIWQNDSCLRSCVVQTLNKLKRPASEAASQARCKRDRRSRKGLKTRAPHVLYAEIAWPWVGQNWSAPHSFPQLYN